MRGFGGKIGSPPFRIYRTKRPSQKKLKLLPVNNSANKTFHPVWDYKWYFKFWMTQPLCSESIDLACNIQKELFWPQNFIKFEFCRTNLYFLRSLLNSFCLRFRNINNFKFNFSSKTKCVLGVWTLLWKIF